MKEIFLIFFAPYYNDYNQYYSSASASNLYLPVQSVDGPYNSLLNSINFLDHIIFYGGFCWIIQKYVYIIWLDIVLIICPVSNQ